MGAAYVVRIECLEMGLAPIAEKQRILDYLKSGKPYCASARSVNDRITGELTGLEDNWKTDGVYCWSEDTIYHFEKYNAVISAGFVNCVIHGEKQGFAH